MTKEKLGKDLPKYALFVSEGKKGGKTGWNNLGLNTQNHTLHTFLQTICNKMNSDNDLLNMVSKILCKVSPTFNLNSWLKEEKEVKENEQNQELELCFLPCSSCGVKPTDSVKIYEDSTGKPVCQICMDYQNSNHEVI